MPQGIPIGFLKLLEASLKRFFSELRPARPFLSKRFSTREDSYKLLYFLPFLSLPVIELCLATAQELLDFFDIFFAQVPVRRRGGFDNLLWTSRADYGGGQFGPAQDPAYCQLGAGPAITLGDLFQILDKFERSTKLRLKEIGTHSAMVVRSQGLKAGTVEFARKQAPLDRAVRDDAHLVPPAIVQQFIFHFAMEHAVGRLERDGGVNLLHAFDLLDGEIRYAEVSNLALIEKPGHFLPGLFDVFVGVGPVHLVEVDDVDAESFQAGMTFVPDARV